MKRDDRPRQSKPKPKPEAGAVPPPVCSECGFVFTEEAVKRGARLRKRKDDSVCCQEDKACRTRQLTTTMGLEIGATPPEDWLFFRYPRELVKARMDVRPKDWRQSGWQARYSLPDRVLACILYHSWCYPVSLSFAVQLAGTLPHPARRDFDDDEILRDIYKQPRPLREVDIAVILNEHKTNVNARGIKRLVATKDIRVDEDNVFYPAARLAEMTIAERQALYLPDRLHSDPDDELRGVPKRYRKALALIEAQCPEDISTDIFSRALDRCSQFNDGLRVLRTDRDSGIEQDCLRAATLLPELEKLFRAKPSPSARASDNALPVTASASTAVPPSVAQSAVYPPPPSIDRSSSEGIGDQGKGALAKLDRPRPRPQTDRPSGADNPYSPKIREWLETTFADLPTSLEDRELDQIAATIHSDQHFEQFQKAAQRQKEPRGWKVFVKIALECQKHQGKYKQAGAGGERESPMVKQLREQQELKKSWQSKS
jgi:hypothetical protein